MGRVLVCPKCAEELDIPEELLDGPVRCASCTNVFTAPRGGSAPVVRATRQDSDDDNDRTSSLDYDRPRRRSSTSTKAKGSGSKWWLWFLILGTFGICFLGCGGLIGVGIYMDNPKMVPYEAPDQSFKTGFPGKPKVVTLKDDEKRNQTNTEWTRTIMGQPFETFFVNYVDLDKKPKTDADRDKILEEFADAMLAKSPGTDEDARTKMTYQGFPTLELHHDHNDETQTFVRIVIIGKRVYTVGITGRGLAPESMRLKKFWEQFTPKTTTEVKPKGEDI
jgi:ribosomal protein S27E